MGSGLDELRYCECCRLVYCGGKLYGVYTIRCAKLVNAQSQNPASLARFSGRARRAGTAGVANHKLLEKFAGRCQACYWLIVVQNSLTLLVDWLRQGTINYTYSQPCYRVR